MSSEATSTPKFTLTAPVTYEGAQLEDESEAGYLIGIFDQAGSISQAEIISLAESISERVAAFYYHVHNWEEENKKLASARDQDTGKLSEAFLEYKRNYWPVKAVSEGGTYLDKSSGKLTTAGKNSERTWEGPDPAWPDDYPVYKISLEGRQPIFFRWMNSALEDVFTASLAPDTEGNGA